MDDFLKEFFYNKEQMQTIGKLLCDQIHKGLARETHDSADVKCFVTYVQDLPTGEEVGKALALDLGGANFRVLLVTLKGEHDATVEATIYALSQELMRGEGTKLFDYIAECLSSFVKERKLNGVDLPLGFTFSFPCVQKGLTQALLVRWTKGFDCAGVVNEDVGRLLKEALERRGDMTIRVVAVLNDTIGTLMSCAHRNSGCRVGLIVGTGCNACYLERCSKVELLEDEYKRRAKHVIINCEWGAFGESGILDFIRTEYDREIDRKSINKGQQIFEKMLSGMYLGEIARLVMLKAMKLNLMFANSSFKAQILEKLSQENIFLTCHISDIEGDCPPDYNTTRGIIKDLLGIDKPNDDDVRCIRMICEAISIRSATLVGLGVSILINRVNESNVIVGVDGSVYRLHPKYDRYMRTAMRKMVNPKLSFDLMLSEDGSGRGAALVAAAAKEETAPKDETAPKAETAANDETQ